MVFEKIQAQAARNSLSKSHSLIQLGISWMVFATLISAAVTIWQINHSNKPPTERPFVAVGNLTFEPINQDTNQNLFNQPQAQLILDAISSLSTQIVELREQLDSLRGNTGSLSVNGRQGDFRQHPPTRDLYSRWIWLFNAVAMAVWLLGAGICACGLRTWPVRDVVRFLSWGLSAGSSWLAIFLFCKNVDTEWVYVMITAMPAYVAMTISLSVIVGDGEEAKQE